MEKSRGNRSGRGAALVAVVVASLVAFASLGGVGLAQSAVGLAQYQYGKKITICHKGKNTIRISVRAWPAHKRHGDTEGACVKAKHAKKNHKHSGQGSTAGTVHGKKAEHSQGDVSSNVEGATKGKSSGKGHGGGHDK